MICRTSRDKLALALRGFVASRISNDELAEIEIDWRDRGAVAVQKKIWFIEDDMRAHHATGKYAIKGEQRHVVARWIVFLCSDNEYFWPEYNFIQIYNWPMNLLTFGWWERRKEKLEKEFEKAGGISVWPFISTSDFNIARQNPKYFSASLP